MKHARQRIAIIGGNFAGLTAAIKLSRRYEVTVIDPSQHFEWMPNIHEILSGVKTPQGLRLDRAAIVEQAGHRFVQDRVTELDPVARRLLTAGGHELSFDACIVALGALWNTHGIPGVDRHALPCRSIAEALAIEQRLRTLVQRGKPLHIVIVGAGISGIEVLGEWREGLVASAPAVQREDVHRAAAPPHEAVGRIGRGNGRGQQARHGGALSRSAAGRASARRGS
jgi:NADH dehydrogenase